MTYSLSKTLLGACAAVMLSGIAGAQEKPSLSGRELPSYQAPSDGLLGEIAARGSIRNGVEAQNPPFEYIEGGEIVGYDIVLSRMFAEYIGVELDVIDTAWSGVIPSLYTKKFDMIWSAMTITAPRKKAVTFSQPYASDQVEFIVISGDDRFKTIADLDGMSLGTQLNSAAEFQAQELIKEHGLDVELRSFDHFDGAYLDLKNGNVDIVTSTKLNDRVLFLNNPGVYDVALELPIYNYVGVATRQQDSDLSGAIDDFIDQLQASGELAELQMEWFGHVMDLPE